LSGRATGGREEINTNSSKSVTKKHDTGVVGAKTKLERKSSIAIASRRSSTFAEATLSDFEDDSVFFSLKKPIVDKNYLDDMSGNECEAMDDDSLKTLKSLKKITKKKTGSDRVGKHSKAKSKTFGSEAQPVETVAMATEVFDENQNMITVNRKDADIAVSAKETAKPKRGRKRGGRGKKNQKKVSKDVDDRIDANVLDSLPKPRSNKKLASLHEIDSYEVAPDSPVGAPAERSSQALSDSHDPDYRQSSANKKDTLLSNGPKSKTNGMYAPLNSEQDSENTPFVENKFGQEIPHSTPMDAEEEKDGEDASSKEISMSSTAQNNMFPSKNPSSSFNIISADLETSVRTDGHDNPQSPIMTGNQDDVLEADMAADSDEGSATVNRSTEDVASRSFNFDEFMPEPFRSTSVLPKENEQKVSKNQKKSPQKDKTGQFEKISFQKHPATSSKFARIVKTCFAMHVAQGFANYT
jgi:hypothetical protein